MQYGLPTWVCEFLFSNAAKKINKRKNKKKKKVKDGTTQ